jgi:hypothetical protein
MLTKHRPVLAAMAAGLIVMTPAFAGVAAADTSPVVVQGDTKGGAVDTTVTSPGKTASTGPTAVPASTASAAPTCVWTVDQVDNTAILAGAEGVGSVRQGGSYYDVTCSDGSAFPGVYVPAGSAAAATAAVVTPGQLALQARSRLPLPAPVAGHNPTVPLVHLAIWWWVAPESWRALSQQTTAGPVWATVTATPVASRWDPGDGSPPVSCAGPGVAYDPTLPLDSQASSCAFTYARSSAGQPQAGPNPNDRFFPVTVTVIWRVDWQGSAGTAGVLPALTTTSTFPLPVAQRQTLVTREST